MALIGLIAGLVGYQLLHKKAAETSKALAALPVPKNELKLPQPPKMTVDVMTAPVKMTADQLKELRHSILGDGIYGSAMIVIMYGHPELKLSPKEQADLQKIYSEHYARFAAFQAEIAQVSVRPDGTTVVAIPDFAKVGAALVGDLSSDVAKYYQGTVPSGLASAIEDSFRNAINSGGQAPTNYEVKLSSDPNCVYDLTERSVTINSVYGGQLTGTAMTSYSLRQEDLKYSPYLELKKYFPKPKSGFAPENK